MDDSPPTYDQAINQDHQQPVVPEPLSVSKLPDINATRPASSRSDYSGSNRSSSNAVGPTTFEIINRTDPPSKKCCTSPKDKLLRCCHKINIHSCCSKCQCSKKNKCCGLLYQMRFFIIIVIIIIAIAIGVTQGLIIFFGEINDDILFFNNEI